MKALVKGESDVWRIESAGVWAMIRAPAAENTLQVLRERGVDLTSHLARQISGRMVEEFNLILTMERNHQEALQAAFPDQSEKIHMLTELVGIKGDITDPIGFPILLFEETAREIEKILEKGFEHIRRLAEGQDDESN